MRFTAGSAALNNTLMITDNFWAAVKEYKMFEPGEKVLIAVSGGADSTALLNLLYASREELGVTLHVAHLNHLLRRGEAELDVKFVEAMAQKMGLPVIVETVNVGSFAKQEKLGLEEAARVVRDDFFGRAAANV